ncbi:hypothetical protein [Fodinicola acaciae]|uniref:hypothetical protein n=1 Tax=Fodinicola acaciae TaxID=2681555 RepID=UPI0013D38E26|nr:hypothetical protein [Fodinicola acaciae]
MTKEKPLPPDLPGGFSRRQALRHGVTRAQLRGRRIARLAHGKLAFECDLTDVWSWARALVATFPAGTVVSHTTALRLFGGPLPRELTNDGSLHVTVPPRNPCPRLRGITSYRGAPLS